jgi:hypothetical protein
MLEPDPYFIGGVLYNPWADNCKHNLVYFNATTKTWNCPWDVNSLSNWLTTDGIKIVVDTSLAPASVAVYYVETKYHLWCTCTDSTYTQYSSRSAYFYIQIKTTPLTSVTTA